MPTRNVNLTPELDSYISRKLASGFYESVSEVVRAGLRALEAEDREQEAKLERLRQALAAGEASGVAEDGVFERVRERMERRAAGKDA
jgi:antitoxin ParD1/3/4